ncbi:MAG: hypothetical protein JO142_21455 [Burkholderiales bacterium]|nr:hypothetical protein [Burkholderiales bacterium]
MAQWLNTGRFYRMTAALIAVAACGMGYAEESAAGLLPMIKKHTTLTSTIPDNGDLNPYAVVVAPATVGKLTQGDVLITNFNNTTNLQGTGTTIVDYNPSTKRLTTFAQLSHELPGCPGGVGLGTALAVLKSGWVVVGSTPSNDGLTDSKGAGCLIVLDANGKVNQVVADELINDPWGNMAVVDNGTTATLFLSNAGFGVGSANGKPPVVNKATVLRVELSIPEGKAPQITSKTVVADGFGEQADKSVFLVGPTGLALGEGGKLYVSDALANRIVVIDDALHRTSSGGTGSVVTEGGMLSRPLAMTTTPLGHLLVTNGLNGKVVEIDPVAGKQLYSRWIDANKAQTPPGNGDLFGLAMTPDGRGFYYVEDDVNTLVLAQ